jgi:hypothetical protein
MRALLNACLQFFSKCSRILGFILNKFPDRRLFGWENAKSFPSAVCNRDRANSQDVEEDRERESDMDASTKYA